MKRTYFLLLFWIIPFWGLAQQTQYRLGVPLWHTDKVRELKYAPDGSKMLTVSYDHSVKVWEVRTGRLIQTLKIQDEEASILSASISPDGQYVFGAVENMRGDGPIYFQQSIYKWEINSGLYELFKGDGGYSSERSTYEVVFTADGKKMITAEGNRISIWDASDYSLLQELKYEGQWAHNLLVSDNGEDLFYIDQNLLVYHWSLKSYQLLGYFKLPSRGNISLSADGHYLVGFTENGDVEVYNTEQHQKLWSAKESSSVLNLEISPNSRYLGYFLSDGVSKIKDLKSGGLLHEITVDENFKEYNLIKFSLSGSSFFTLRTVGQIVEINLESGEEIKQWPTLHQFYPDRAAMSSDGRQIVLSYDSELQIWNIQEGKLEHSVSGYSVSTMKSSQDNSHIFSGPDFFPGGVIYNLQEGYSQVVPQNLTFVDFTGETGFLALDEERFYLCENENPTDCRTFDNLKIPIEFAELSSDSRFVLARNQEHKYLIFDLENHWLVKEYPVFTFGAALSPTGRYLTGISEEHGLQIFDLENGILKFESSWTPDPYVDEYYSQTFSKDGSRLFISGTNHNYLFDLSGDDIQEIMAPATLVKPAGDFEEMMTVLKAETTVFSPLADELTIGHEDGYISVYNFDQEGVSDSYVYHASDEDLPVKLLKYTPDGKNLLYNSIDHGISLWDKESSEPSRVFKGHAAAVLEIEFLKNPQYFFSGSEDGKIFLWDLQSGNKVLEIFKLGDSHLILLPDGYYMGTQEAIRQLYYIDKNSKTIGFDQLDVKYNRPDKVLQVLGDVFGEPDEELIESYHRAWQKRIQKLKIDTASFNAGFSVPESDFKNRDQIVYEQTGNQLKLKVWGKDKDYKLDRYNVWVNDVPVFGQNGVSIRNKNLNEINEAVSLTLSEGTNKIETSVMNVNGIESYRQPLYVRYTSKEKPKEKLYFIGIGIDHYQQSDYNLTYSGKDIEDLAAGLKEKYGDNIEIKTFIDQEATRDNIMEIQQLLNKTNVDDKVIISFSGHGLLNKELDYYLSTYDVDFERPEHRGLSYEDLESLLDGIPARKKLLLIDACHSGELDKEEMMVLQQKAENLKKGQKGSIVVSVKEGDSHKRMGLKNSFELMQELFVNVNKGTGATIIAASAGTQFAYEKGDLKNGVFTYSILNLMNEKENMTVNELKSTVSEQVEKLTDGLQKPTARNENIENDWKVWGD